MVVAAAAAPAPVPLPVPAAGPADLACGLDLYRDGRGGPLRGAGIGPWRGVPGEEILPWGERGPPLDEGRGGGDRRKRRRRRRRSGGGGEQPMGGLARLPTGGSPQRIPPRR